MKKGKKNIKKQQKKEECSICYNNIKHSHKKQLICDHFFHMKCIYRWFKISSTCPLCRKQVSHYPHYGAQYNEYYYYVNSFNLSKRILFGNKKCPPL